MRFSRRAQPGTTRHRTAEAAPTVVTAMWRVVDVFRPIAWLYAVYSALVRHDEIARPWLAWVVLGVLGVWTVGMVFYRTRNTRVVGIELVLACAAILSTRLVDTPEVILDGAKTLPGFWPEAAVAAWAGLVLGEFRRLAAEPQRMAARCPS